MLCEIIYFGEIFLFMFVFPTENLGFSFVVKDLRFEVTFVCVEQKGKKYQKNLNN